MRTKLETNHSFGKIIGKTEKMQHLFTQIQRAAVGDITVLIQGETGTGKRIDRKINTRYQPAKNRSLRCRQLCCDTRRID